MNVEPAGDPYREGDLVEARSHPQHWFNRASDLRAAAGGLWLAMRQTDATSALGLDPGFNMALATRPVYHLLCGMALEVILKAVLAQRGQPIPAIHRLNNLADEVGLDRSDAERQLLRYYSEVVYWAGKYPTPKDPTDGKLTDYFALAVDTLTIRKPLTPGALLAQVISSGVDHWESFHALWQRAAALFVCAGLDVRVFVKVPDTD